MDSIQSINQLNQSINLIETTLAETHPSLPPHLGRVNQLLHERDDVGPEDGEREGLSGHEDDAGVGHQHDLLHEVLFEDVAAGHLERVAEVLQ